jgi:hypothetical protein
MKHRGGPLCPCCRRDFIIDPFDLDDVEDALDSPSHDHDEENPSTNVPDMTIRSKFIHHTFFILRTVA